MDGAPLFRPRQLVLSNPVGVRGISSDDAWHRIASALEAGGYLARRQSQADGRSVTLRLTDKGHKVVARDPFEALVRAVGSLNPQDQTAMREALHRVLTTLAASGTRQHFGVCRDCAHLSGEMNADSKGTRRS